MAFPLTLTVRDATLLPTIQTAQEAHGPTSLPQARQHDLVVQASGDELLVFDRRNDHVCAISPAAAALWPASNGTRAVPEIAT